MMKNAQLSQPPSADSRSVSLPEKKLCELNMDAVFDLLRMPLPPPTPQQAPDQQGISKQAVSFFLLLASPFYKSARQEVDAFNKSQRKS